MLDRELGNYKLAIDKHLEAINILKSRGLNFYLAETVFNQGITLKRMGNIVEVQLAFQEAIKSFHSMGAFRQIERVKKA